MVGFAVSAYTAAYITSILAGILGSGSGSAASASADALGGIASFNFSFDVEEAVFLISLMIIIHAIAGGIVIKIAEGGYIYAGLFDICILLWLGAIFHYAIPSIIETLLPGMASSFAPIR
jgi:archaellum biogenesis protein FlaJ (TadC family)